MFRFEGAEVECERQAGAPPLRQVVRIANCRNGHPCCYHTRLILRGGMRNGHGLRSSRLAMRRRGSSRRRSWPAPPPVVPGPAEPKTLEVDFGAGAAFWFQGLRGRADPAASPAIYVARLFGTPGPMGAQLRLGFLGTYSFLEEAHGRDHFVTASLQPALRLRPASAWFTVDVGMAIGATAILGVQDGSALLKRMLPLKTVWFGRGMFGPR